MCQLAWSSFDFIYYHSTIMATLIITYRLMSIRLRAHSTRTVYSQKSLLHEVPSFKKTFNLGSLHWE